MEERDGSAVPGAPQWRSFSPDQAACDSMSLSFDGAAVVSAAPAESSSSPLSPFSVKKKRGRPRKHCADGAISLALVPAESSEKRRRGRPPGTGKKQLLASYGEWISSSAGMGFTPHTITIPDGEDISSKIVWLSQQGPRAICVVSAAGAVSAATLRQPASSGGAVTFEGRFEIVSLSGSFVVAEGGGSGDRSGGLSVSLLGPDGRVIGGGVGGLLVAASPVQVFLASFIYRGTKPKSKPSLDQAYRREEEDDGDVSIGFSGGKTV